MKKFLNFLAVALVSACIFGCGNNKEEESIVYGDIDFDAEVVEQVKPKQIEKSSEIVGTTTLNLINGGIFCEDDENLYYVIQYDFEKYLVKQNKKTNELSKVYIGELRNLFVVNNWIYGIEGNDAFEHMIVMDLYGNNIIKSNDFKNGIRTMMSNGEKIYFTVDAINLIGGTNTAIYSCDMDFSNIAIEKSAVSIASQMDIITITNDKIYFHDSYYSTDDDVFKYTTLELSDFPLVIDGKLYSLDEELKQLLNEQGIKTKTYNIKDDYIYIVMKGDGNKNYIVKKSFSTDEITSKEYDKDIDAIFAYSGGIMIRSNNKFERMDD